jgi:hypothetical protein
MSSSRQHTPPQHASSLAQAAPCDAHGVQRRADPRSLARQTSPAQQLSVWFPSQGAPTRRHFFVEVLTCRLRFASAPEKPKWPSQDGGAKSDHQAAAGRTRTQDFREAIKPASVHPGPPAALHERDVPSPSRGRTPTLVPRVSVVVPQMS